MFRHGRILSQISTPSLVLFLVGCCIGSAMGGRLRPRPGPCLSFCFAPFVAPKRQEIVHPTLSASVTSDQQRPLPSQPIFSWLLCLLTKWRPPKVEAPPISQFVDGCPFGAQNKGKESGENKPNPLAPAQDLWRATAP
jgi:hypothetical protein